MSYELPKWGEFPTEQDGKLLVLEVESCESSRVDTLVCRTLEEAFRELEGQIDTMKPAEGNVTFTIQARWLTPAELDAEAALWEPA